MEMMTSLLMAATYRRAAAMQQWLFNHRDCHAWSIEFSNDGTFTEATCACGDVFESVVIIDISVKVKRKCAQLA